MNKTCVKNKLYSIMQRVMFTMISSMISSKLLEKKQEIIIC
jgi:hypothetical protein